MQTIQSHVENHVHILIEDLRTSLLIMAARTQEAIDNACSSLIDKDAVKASLVIEGDQEIDELEVQIDASALNILARTQPVACDLRLLISSIRLVVDLERIADEATNIATRVVLMQDHAVDLGLPFLKALAQKSQSMLRESITSFREGDTHLAALLRAQQDEMTQLVVQGLEYVISALQSGEIDAWFGMHLILITRALERVCGRAVNVAEHTYFLVEGVNIKHRPLAE